MRTACLTFAALAAASGLLAAPARACPDEPVRGISSLPPASVYQPLRPVSAPRRIYTSSTAYTYVAPAYAPLQPRATYVPRRYTPARYRTYYVHR
jgi:hypothetical protein